jgi:hypothetical protein
LQPSDSPRFDIYEQIYKEKTKPEEKEDSSPINNIHLNENKGIFTEKIVTFRQHQDLCL